MLLGTNPLGPLESAIVRCDSLSTWIYLLVELFYLGVPDGDDLGTVFTSLSIGDPLGGVTIGIALPFNFARDNFNDDLEFVGLLFGAEKQISNSLKFITENWLMTTQPDPEIFLSAGLRFIGDSQTVGFGIIYTGEAFMPWIPWLDFSLSFGR